MKTLNIYVAHEESYDKVIIRLLEKAFSSHMRTIVFTSSPSETEKLAERLWTYSPMAFLPHGTAVDGHAKDQPIWITNELEDMPNQAVFCLALRPLDKKTLDSFEKIAYVTHTQHVHYMDNATSVWTICADYKRSWFVQGTNGQWIQETIEEI